MIALSMAHKRIIIGLSIIQYSRDNTILSMNEYDLVLKKNINNLWISFLDYNLIEIVYS
jgi:hypothetical protein